MKREITSLLCCMALVCISSCIQEEVRQEPGTEGTSITLISEGPTPTRTVMNTTGDNVSWTTGEKVHCYLDQVLWSSKGNNNVTTALTTEGLLKVTLNNVTTAPQQSIGGFVGTSSTKNDLTGDGKTKAYGMSIPENQKATELSFDPEADLLVMDNVDVSGYDFSQPVKLEGIRYNRLMAVTRLDINAIAAECEGDRVLSIAFSTATTPISGNFRYDPILKQYMDEANPAQGHNEPVFIGNPSRTINLDVKDSPILIKDGRFTTWMILPAINLKAEEVSFKIVTDKHIITKSRQISSLQLFKERLNILNVPMDGARVQNSDQSICKVVTSLQEITAAGEYYLCSADNRIFNGNAGKAKGMALGTETVTINGTEVSGLTIGQIVKLEPSGTGYQIFVPLPKGSFYVSTDGNKLGFPASSAKAAIWNISIDASYNCTISNGTKALYCSGDHINIGTEGNLPKLLVKTKAEPEQPPVPEPTFSNVGWSHENGQYKVSGTVQNFTPANQTDTGIWYARESDGIKTELQGEYKSKKSTISGQIAEQDIALSTVYHVGLYVVDKQGVKHYSAGELLRIEEPVQQPAPVWADKPVRNVVYLQSHACNPLNILEYKLTDGRPFFDAVILFAAEIRYNEQTNHFWLETNKHIQAMLDEQSVYLQPLRDAGIKVYMGLLGPGNSDAPISNPDRDPSGLCQLSTEGAKDFAQYMAGFCKRYNLDGVNLDDEYVMSSPYQTNPMFAKRSGEAGLRLAYELKQALKKTCPWETEVSTYAYSYFHTQYQDGITIEGHQAGEFIDFQYGNYGSTGRPVAGFTIKQCSGKSIELHNNSGGPMLQSSAEDLKNKGYGWVMWFSFCPFVEHKDYNLPRSLRYFNEAARGLYGTTLVNPTHYYKLSVTGPGKMDPTPYPLPAQL